MNDGKPEVVMNKVRSAVDCFKNPAVDFMGLAFKPDIDDLRSSPALDITKTLASELKCKMLAVEPNIEELSDSLSGLPITLTDTMEALEQADILVLLVDYKPFRHVRQNKLAEKIIIDTRGIWTTGSK